MNSYTPGVGPGPMEYVILRSVRPTRFTMQLPTEAASLLRYRDPSAKSPADGTGSITFLARGTGIARAFATHLSKEVLAVESVRERFLTNARPGEGHLFAFPARLITHLGIEEYPLSPGRARGTDDTVVWFLPAREYYEYRAGERSGSWKGPSVGGSAHVYVAKGILPIARGLMGLDRMESEIENGDWAVTAEALRRTPSARRSTIER